MKNLNIIILAAGIGSRMKSSHPKAMHLLGNAPLIDHLIFKSNQIQAKNIVAVIGDDTLDMAKHLENKVILAYQKQRLGSAHAVLSAEDSLKNHSDNNVTMVLYADTPLISIETMEEIYNKVNAKECDVCLVAFEEQEANSYGKLVIKDNKFQKIVEHKEANAQEKLISLCNSGIIAFRGDKIWDILHKIDNNNSTKEYYLTDAIAIANSEGLKCSYVKENKNNVLGANTKKELSILEEVFQNSQREKFLNQGVQLIDPKNTYFSLDTEIGEDVIIYPNVYIGNNVKIANKVEIKPFCSLEGVSIGEGCTIGPFARVREGTILESQVHIGNFVELKQTHLKTGVKAGHLSYLGNSTIGQKTNIGAGTITCNYDGKNKHQTIIGDNSFIGSNSSLIAPITIGKNATIGAGATIVKDVEDNALAISVAKQKNTLNWKKIKY